MRECGCGCRAPFCPSCLPPSHTHARIGVILRRGTYQRGDEQTLLMRTTRSQTCTDEDLQAGEKQARTCTERGLCLRKITGQTKETDGRCSSVLSFPSQRSLPSCLPYSRRPNSHIVDRWVKELPFGFFIFWMRWVSLIWVGGWVDDGRRSAMRFVLVNKCGRRGGGWMIGRSEVRW